MSNEIKIDKDVPLPQGSDDLFLIRLIDRLGDMQYGDSIQVELHRLHLLEKAAKHARDCRWQSQFVVSGDRIGKVNAS